MYSSSSLNFVNYCIFNLCTLSEVNFPFCYVHILYDYHKCHELVDSVFRNSRLKQILQLNPSNHREVRESSQIKTKKLMYAVCWCEQRLVCPVF